MQRPSATTLHCANSPLAINEQTTCTATVSDTSDPTAGNPDPPTGTVKVSGNKTDTFTANPCTLQVFDAQDASCDVFYIPEAGPNTHQLAANYAGDAGHKGSRGTFSITVTQFSP
jgi:hypothetical protein